MILLVSIFISVAVAIVTLNLTKKRKLSPTRASALVSVFGFGLLFIISRIYSFDLNHFASLVFGASFVGMCSHKVITDLEVAVGALIFSVLFSLILPHTHGVGGALGFSAFVSILLIWMVSRFLMFKKFSV